MKQREFIKGYHVNLKFDGKVITQAILLDKAFHWEVPEEWLGGFKKGDLVVVNVHKKDVGLSKSVVFVDETFTDAEKVEGMNLKFAQVKYNTKKSRVIKRLLRENPKENPIIEEWKKSLRAKKNKKVEEPKIEQPIVQEVIVEEKVESLASILAAKCNLSEKSIAGLLKKYDEEKVKRAVDMYLATEDRKAPLKFLKFILEKIS